MKKGLLSGLLAGMLLLGSSMTVFAEEPVPETKASVEQTAEQASEEQQTAEQESEDSQAVPAGFITNYQQIMTPEILQSFMKLDENILVTEEEEAWEILRNAIVRRTDAWGKLQDADGDGIDDRDPINGCGYLDVNCNGYDDRFELIAIDAAAQENPVEGELLQRMFNLLSHCCKHGITVSEFVYDEEMGYISMPNYFDQCPECEEELYEALGDALDMFDALSTISE